MSDVDALWNAYRAAEKDRIREVSLAALDRLIGALLQEPDGARAAWALGVVKQVVDDQVDIPIRLPLFRKVVLPALIDGVLQGRAGCARWLARFDSLLHHSKEQAGRLPETLRRPPELLEEALRVDPEDSRARRALIGIKASYLDYTLHELPSGVLYGHDGATVEQCAELLEELATFRGHLERAGRVEEFADLTAECDLHYHAYRDYLQPGLSLGSYERYLKSRGLI